MKKIYSIIMAATLTCSFMYSQGNSQAIFSFNHFDVLQVIPAAMNESPEPVILEINIVVDIVMVEERYDQPSNRLYVQNWMPDFQKLSLAGAINTLDHYMIQKTIKPEVPSALVQVKNTFINKLEEVKPNYLPTHNTNLNEGFGVRFVL